jgi:vacuolar-type H+-ATPase subunit C/Vma6
MRWDDVNARARGLATHLLHRSDFLRFGQAATWSAAAAQAVGAGFPADPGALGSFGEFERAIGQVVSRRLRLLGRWLGPREPAAALVLEDEDRRSLRTLLRGAAAGVAPVIRLRALTPSPTLSERTLARLAQAGSPAALARSLLRLGHPAGRALSDAASEPSGTAGRRAGLFPLEVALSRLFARRAMRGARRAGRQVGGFVALAIDRENAGSLLLAPAWVADVAPDEVFLAGGTILEPADFAAIARLADPGLIQTRLAERFRATPLAPAFEAAQPAQFESRAAAAVLHWYRRVAREDPLGPGVLFHVLERIRAEAHDLRLVLARLTLGLGPDLGDPLLVTLQ